MSERYPAPWAVEDVGGLFCSKGQQRLAAGIHLLRGRCRPPISREAIDPQCRATDRSRYCQVARAIAEGLICLKEAAHDFYGRQQQFQGW
jgi:hypothetical protein